MAQATPPAPDPPDRAARRTRRCWALGAVGYLVVLALLVPHDRGRRLPVCPTASRDDSSALPDGSVVLVDDGIGAWMEWAVPEVDPVIDGMLDAYPVGYIRDFFDFRDLQPGWQDFVDRSGARVAVVRRDAPVAAALQDQLGWRRVATDGAWVYLTAGPAQP